MAPIESMRYDLLESTWNLALNIDGAFIIILSIALISSLITLVFYCACCKGDGNKKETPAPEFFEITRRSSVDSVGSAKDDQAKSTGSGSYREYNPFSQHDADYGGSQRQPDLSLSRRSQKDYVNPQSPQSAAGKVHQPPEEYYQRRQQPQSPKYANQRDQCRNRLYAGKEKYSPAPQPPPSKPRSPSRQSQQPPSRPRSIRAPYQPPLPPKSPVSLPMRKSVDEAKTAKQIPDRRPPPTMEEFASHNDPAYRSLAGLSAMDELFDEGISLPPKSEQVRKESFEYRIRRFIRRQPLEAGPSEKSHRTYPKIMEIIRPDHAVNPKDHFYPSALNATLHPTLKKLVNMNNVTLAKRYCQRHPDVDCAILSKLMNGSARYYRWGGADLIRSVDMKNRRKMVVIEMNSCPSGNKSVPYGGWGYEGFRRVMANAFTPLLDQTPIIDGALAVFYDVKKQRPESYAYACMLSQITNECVYLVDVGYGRELPNYVRWTKDGICQLDLSESRIDRQEIITEEKWRDLRAIFRYVTRRPWLKLPVLTKTLVLNPVVACLAGGRNKLLAAQAYDMFNKRYADAGLQINIPLTITNVVKASIPEHARAMNHQLVVKVPYSNCGVGVYTITSPKELEEFMRSPHSYDKFVVQGLISHPEWPSSGSPHQLHHVGCRPSYITDKNDSYVADVRFMICAGPDGWMPVAVYSRRAERPLKPVLDEQRSSWEMLGTNLSTGEDGTSGTDTSRLMLFDTKSFADMGLDLDDLVECYVQTVLAATAVDDMCKELIVTSSCGSAEGFNLPLFRKWDDDWALLSEIANGCPRLVEIYPELILMSVQQEGKYQNEEVAAVKNSNTITIENIVAGLMNHSCPPVPEEVPCSSTVSNAMINGDGMELMTTADQNPEQSPLMKFRI